MYANPDPYFPRGGGAGDRYIQDKPLPAPAARRLAEKETAQHKRDWLAVNIHKDWTETKGGVGGRGGEARMVEFDKAKGREEVGVRIRIRVRMVSSFSVVGSPRSSDSAVLIVYFHPLWNLTHCSITQTT